MEDCHRSSRWVSLLTAILLLAFALRMFHLAQQPLSWDEGWSIGLSSLSWSEINRITALDVHPPVYYYAFKLWLGLGRNELWMRFLSVTASLLTIPLAYAAGKIWAHTAHLGEQAERVGLFAALVTAVSPFLVYYGQVARMFALAAALSTLAAYCLLKAIHTGRHRFYVGFVLSGAAALYTFYYTALVLAAVWLYALFARPSRWRGLVMSGAALAVLYAPWLAYAVPPMLQRVGSRTGFALATVDALRFLADGVFGLVFAYETGWWAVCATVALLVCAFFLAKRKWESLRLLALPLLAIVLTLVAVSIGANAHMFAARYLISASPFLALAIAWALAACWTRSRWLGVLAVLLFLASTLPTMTRYVYSKAYEVSGTFDPQADYRYLRDKALPEDIIFFNVLSLAGHYEHLRVPADPPWSYVLRWDPVIEPLEPALAERVRPAIAEHRRLWFVLYKGTVAANAGLKEWLDLNLFPALGQWREDTLYLLYLSPTAQMQGFGPGPTFDGRIRLQAADFTPRTQAGDRVTVTLIWTTSEALEQNYKVFVHLYTADGQLVAQHDAIPVDELRPTQSWQPGQEIIDRHGLLVPKDALGPLRLVVGLYEPETGTRLTVTDGADHADIGIVEVVPES
jgi:mannosyltransferase